MVKNNIFYLLLSAPKTIIFNLKYFDFKDAIKFPVLVSYKTYLSKLEGSVEIQGELKRGMITIGFGDVAIFDKKRSRTIFKNQGKIYFEGKASIGHGAKIGVGHTGELFFGDNFMLTAESEIVCKKKISFGRNCLLSWNILLMDCDFHKIKNSDNKIVNPDKEIIIGNKVWIGARSMIKKGISIADGTIIGSQSVVVKNITTPGQIWAGNPAVLIKENMQWEM
jgi:acetyltransferase-like isoleucine patch superfamily enzyme